MFIIKNYDFGSTDYTAYECKSYRREYAGESHGVDKDGSHASETYRLILDGEQNIHVSGRAYIENADGKTIDTIVAKHNRVAHTVSGVGIALARAGTTAVMN